jgi:excisionase family DNA binding protein
MPHRIRSVRTPGAAAQNVRTPGADVQTLESAAATAPKLLTVKEAAAYARPLKLLTIKEAAAFAKVSIQTVRRWIKAGLLKIYRAGRQIRINEFDLVDMLSSQELKSL